MTAANGQVGWLFPDPRRAAIDNFRRTKNFPIMHLIGIRRTLVEQHPWLPAAVLKAFEEAKALALARLADTSASRAMLPFLDQQLHEAQALMGENFWPYGIDANRGCLEYFLQQHHKQGLSDRLMTVAELFHPFTFEVARV